jgi:hypothetical protein
METEVNLIFALGALVLFAIGYRLIKRGTPFCRTGGDRYTQKRRRKTLGQTLCAAAGLLMALALVKFFYESSPSSVPDASLAEGNTQEYRPPILPPTASGVVRAGTVPAPVASDGGTGASVILNAIGDLSHAATPSTWAPSAADGHPETSQPSLTALVTNDSKPASSDTQATGAEAQKELDARLNTANEVLQKDPSNAAGYLMRADIYEEEKKWDLAKLDYQQALKLNSAFAPALLNLAEIDLMQAKYDTARAEFADLVQNPDCGDLAKYSVFLCDLAGGREDVAGQELDAFNRVPSDASYYFANVAWLLHHQKSDVAHDWMDSAVRIYSPDKVGRYVTPLVHLGYLPTAWATSASN